MSSRLSDCEDWFELWFSDKKSIIDCMVRNMASDLANGYDYFGKCITEQRKEIEEYKEKLNREIDAFKEMDEKQVNRWCFYDMKKRGAIE